MVNSLSGQSPPGREPPSAFTRDIVGLAAAMVCWAIVVAALYLGQAVLVPLAIAFLISFALSPLVIWLERVGLPRILSVILVMALVVAVLSGLGLLLATQVRALSEELPGYQTTIRGKLSDLRESFAGPGFLRGAIQTVDTVQQEVEPEEEEPAPDAPQRVQVIPPSKGATELAFAWLAPMLQPLATAGIVFVFVFLALLDRADLRDRMLRLMGGNLHRSTKALEDAGRRISRYLLMQLLVNVTYAIPLSLGLWLIGVPGALLWGVVAAVLRFIPYVGPMASAILPISLAFAVDPGWNMLLMTVALIVILELVSNNIVEPLLYGTSTGLSAISLIAAATFWTTLWGPVGLILSTPLTVCLLVIGRYLPQLQFLETLLGSGPALDPPTRIYQRLIAADPDEAIEISVAEIERSSVPEFYDEVGIPLLRMVSEEFSRNSTAEHRLRIANGFDELIDHLREAFPVPDAPEHASKVLCIGGKWEADAIAADMLAHVLALEGIDAEAGPASAADAHILDKLDIEACDIVCIGYFSPRPIAAARMLARRLRQRNPRLRIVVALWNPAPGLLDKERLATVGAEAVITSIEEGLLRLRRMILPDEALEDRIAEAPEDDDARVDALRRSGVLAGDVRSDLDLMAKRAADVFDVGFAVISAIDAEREYIIGQSRELPGNRTTDGTDMIVMPRAEAICDHVVASGETLVVDDTERDPRFVDHPAIRLWNTRFYAGAPIMSADGHVFGALCLLDTSPRTISDEEVKLLGTLAADIAELITGAEGAEPESPLPAEKTSATVGQKLPK